MARYIVHKVGSFVTKDRVLCLGEYSFSTIDRENQLITNTWPYEDVDGADVLDGETDFVIYTPRHRIKKTVFRSYFRMEVLVCLKRLRSQHYAKMSTATQLPPAELQSRAFQSLKYHKSGVTSKCVVEVRADGIFQRDTEGDVMSHIPYTSLVSIDIICDDHDAIALNHSENSSLFSVSKRSELAQNIINFMKAYGMSINEYRKKSLEAALQDDRKESEITCVSFEYQVMYSSQSNESDATPRTLSVSEKYLTEYAKAETVIFSRPLARIYTLILCRNTLQAFKVVYVDGVTRQYYSSFREKIVCELLASCHALGNYQVGVESSEVPETARMIPRKFIHQEAKQFADTVTNVTAMDRELRVVQGIILHLLMAHGHRKTARIQRQLPQGLDEDMHSLTLEFNANTPTSGATPQPNKLFDKVTYMLARELHDIVARHGATHEFISTYLQSLYRLMLAPPAINEFMKVLTEREEEYINTITRVLESQNSVAIYWMFMVLSRLMESKLHQFPCRQLLLSNTLFMKTLLSLLDKDIQTDAFLSELPTMKLCQFLVLLVKTNAEKQLELSEALYQNLATKYRMLLRILFSFPALYTVEACVSILNRMTKTPVFLNYGNSDSPLRYNDEKVPRRSLSFGETLNFRPESYRGAPLAPRSRPFLYSSRRASSRNNTILSSGSSASGSAGNLANMINVQNPKVLLRQYRQFLEAAFGHLKMGLDQYDDPVFLRLRYRCRNVFLQELISHLAGNFEVFRRVYSVDCCQFSGYIGTVDGQREQSQFFLTPRALIAVRIKTKYTKEFEYRMIEEITEATAIPEAFMLLRKSRLHFIYSDHKYEIINGMRALAGYIGIHLCLNSQSLLPTQQMEQQFDQSALESNEYFDVQRPTGRNGFTHLRKKKLCFVNGTIIEFTSGFNKVYELKKLRRIVVPRLEGNVVQGVVVLEFADSCRVAYVPYDFDKFQAALYDGYNYVGNYNVSLSREFTNLNPRMSPKALLKVKQEKLLYLNQDGLYIPAHAALERKIEKFCGEGVTIRSVLIKIIFSFESLNMNVEVEDFTDKSMRGRLEKLSFSSLLQGFNILLEHSCIPPVRTNEICIVLESFCRINNGCYRLATEQSNGGAMVLVPSLAQILDSGDSIAAMWAVNALRSLIADKSRLKAHRAAEKAIRFQVLEHKNLATQLIGLLDPQNLCCTLVILQLFMDVLVVSRHSTYDKHFDAIIKDLGAKYILLLEIVSQNTNAGLTASVICLMKVIIDHVDRKVKRRICDFALDTGLTIQHLHKAFFHSSENAKETYQYIASIWMTHHKASYEMLTRILPHGFIRMISNPMVRKLLKKQRAHQTEDSRRNSKQIIHAQYDGSEWFIRRMQLQIGTLFACDSMSETKVKEDPTRMNYQGESSTDMALLSGMVSKDFMLPDLLWNELTRGELRLALTTTTKGFAQFKANQAAPKLLLASRNKSNEPKWNHAQFLVIYQSIAQELKVDRFYLRVISERIRDGSLQLGEVAKTARAIETGSHRGKFKNSSSLFFASMDIAKDPAKFFSEVYECWLQYLCLGNFPLLGAVDWSACKRNDFILNTGGEQDCQTMFIILIELANVFPDARLLTKRRAGFITELLLNSNVAGEIHNIVELLAGLSQSKIAYTDMCTRRLIRVLLYMSLLSHRRQPALVGNDVNGDQCDIPIMESFTMSEACEKNSVPIAELSLYEETRYALKWSLKIKTVDERIMIKGPFTANGLKEQLDGDLINCHRQINAIYVCCCSKHNYANSNDEHRWSLMVEYPELRWMELTDEPIDARCAAFALKSLRNLLVTDQHNNTSKALWPPTLVNSVVANTLPLALLIQLLIVNESNIRSYVCEMLMSLNEEVLQELYKYGVFYFILSIIATPSVGDQLPVFVPEAVLLKRIHRIQRSSELLEGQSILTDMLPETLISVLDLDSPGQFADIFSGRKQDKRVVWSSTMRLHLQELLGEHLLEFKESLKMSVTARYIYIPIPQIAYPELSGNVCCSSFCLSNFTQFDSDVETVDDPVFVMKSIEEKWRYLKRCQTDCIGKYKDHSGAFEIFGWSKDATYSAADLRSRFRELCLKDGNVAIVRQAFDSLCDILERQNEGDGGKTSDEVIECILKSQLYLLHKYGYQFYSYESSTLDLLIRVLSSHLVEDSKVQSLAMQFLQRLLSVAPKNVPLLVVIEGSWKAILILVERCACGHDAADKENIFIILKLLLTAEEGVQSILKESKKKLANEVNLSKKLDLSTLADNDSSSYFHATEFTSQDSKYAQRVCSMLDDVILSFENIQPWHIQKMSFDIASSLSRSIELQQQIMASTRVFWKALYLILASAENSSVVNNEQESTTALEKQERDMLESAFGALRSLALGPSGGSRSAGLEALANLLPMDFLERLKKPNGHDFCAILLSDIREPTCVWNENTRTELSQLTEDFCTDPNGDGISFLENASRYMYDCLSSEPYVGGVYLLILLEKSVGNLQTITEDILYPTTAVDFIESLLCFLNENRDPKTGIYSDTMPALDCLSLLCDLPAFRPAIVECLEQHVDDEDAVLASFSVATLGRYLLPFDGDSDAKVAASISSRRSLSAYGFRAKTDAPIAMDAEYGNVDYLARQEMAILIINKICGFKCSLERMLAPFCQFTWCLQVISDHLGYEQAFYALSCLAELCDTCLVIAKYVQDSGLWVEILGIALQSRQHVLHEHFLRAEALREPAFEVLYALLMKNLDLREKMYSGLCRFLPYPIVYQIHLDPNKATRFFDDNHDKSDLIWNSHKRTEVRKKLDQVICRNRAERSIVKRDSVLLDDETDFIPYPHNYVAGLYIDRFLSQPDAEKLTNPAYNLELLFQLWRKKLNQMIRFDLSNPPDNLKTTVDEIDKYTMAMTHILRASLDVDESIANSRMAKQILKLVLYCNEHLITGFPYRCVLRIARRLVQFPEITSKEFVELLICRVTMQHPDIPSLLKVLRRILEARNKMLMESETKDDPEYWLRDLHYYHQMLAFLQGLLEKKEQIEAPVLSNVNRVLRIILAEEPKDNNLKHISRSFMGHWHNFTLESRSIRNSINLSRQRGTKLPNNAKTTNVSSFKLNIMSTQGFDVDGAVIEDVASARSFDVDNERKPSNRVEIKDESDDREVDIDGSFIQAPPRSINYTGNGVELTEAIAPSSFRYKGEVAHNSPLPSPTSVRYSTLRARYEPIGTQYHSRKAAEYDDHDVNGVYAIRSRRGSLPMRVDDTVKQVNGNGKFAATQGNIPLSSINVDSFVPQAPTICRRDLAMDGAELETPGQLNQQGRLGAKKSERRYSLLDIWKAPSSAAPNSLLTTLTISRRSRRAAIVTNRLTSKKKRWFNR